MAYLGRKSGRAALIAADIPDNSITAAKIVDATIAAGDLAPNSVDSSELVDGSVDNSHLADDAVGIAELSATGTADATTFLRGDNSWQVAGSTSASDLTSGTLAAARMVGAISAGGGKAGTVVQTVVSTTETGTNAAGSSPTEITDMTVSIDPIFDDSKIIITFNCGGMVSTGTGEIWAKVTGTTTGTVMEMQRYGYQSDTTGEWYPCPIAIKCVDTPGVDTNQTYQLYMRTGSNIAAGSLKINPEETASKDCGVIIATEVRV